MANPFSIEPANPLAALMSGVAGYDRGQKSLQQQALQEAGQLYAQGDVNGALAAAAKGGALEQLMGFAGLRNQDRSFGLQQQQFGESSRHNKATEGLTGQQIAQTGAYQQGQLGVQRGELALKQQQPVEVGTDPFGSGIKAVRDPSAPGGYRRIDINSLATTAPGGVAAQPTAELTGEEYLKTVPQEIRSVIKGLANYEINPTTSSIRGGHRERLAAMAKQYDPSYDQTTYPMRAEAVKKFATGPQGNTIRSFNVAIDHLETLSDLTKALQNKDVNLYNSVKNKIETQFGYTAPSNFDSAKSIVGAEIAKAIVGGQFALQDREEIRQQLSNARSEPQLLGVINTFQKLMAGQLRGLKQQYEDTTRLKNFDSRLNAVTIRVMSDIERPTSGLTTGGGTERQGGVVDWKTYFGGK